MVVKKPIKRELKPRKKCLGKCQKDLALAKFYKSTTDDYADGLYPICKDCINNSVNPEKIEEVKDQLIKLNRPFLMKVWLSAQEEAERRSFPIFGTYLKNIQLNYKDLTWKDSEIEETNQTIKNSYNEKGKIIDAEYVDQNIPIILQNLEPISNSTIEKWGEGHTPEEYRAFERKYKSLKNNYQERTAMHTEALVTYIRYRVKEEIATSKNDSKSAKEWGAMAKDAATAAKINPNQLSQADLSNGLDNFGQLVRSVEQAIDVIPILPRFKERPNDKVDFTIWCYINYIRDLKSLPLAKYSDIYEFYEQRKKDYEESIDANSPDQESIEEDIDYDEDIYNDEEGEEE